MKRMRFRAGLLALLCTAALALPVGAEGAEGEGGWSILIDRDMLLDLSDLPCQPYLEGETLMVPLRKIGEGLGYTVDWDSGTGAITMEDAYVQKVTLFDGSDTAAFTGKLQIIDMTRQVTTSAAVAVHGGYTYVQVELFEEFLNEVTVTDGQIAIVPQRVELAEDTDI